MPSQSSDDIANCRHLALTPTASATAPVKFHEPGEATTAGAALTFSTAALAADHVLVGHSSLDLRAKLSATDASFYVQLLAVDAMNKETLVNDGFLKASHRMSHTNPTPVLAGQDTDYHIEVRASHYRFAAGHRLRIRIWGGSKDALIQPDASDVTITTGSASTLHVPNFAAAAL